MTLAEVKTFINEIKVINLKQERILDIINSRITEINNLPLTTPLINKVKIPHDADKIINIVYVSDRGDIYFEQGRRFNSTGAYIQSKGVYRFTIISEHQFNIRASVEGVFLGQGVNKVLIFNETNIEKVLDCRLTAVDATVVRVSIRWFLEFIHEI